VLRRGADRAALQRKNNSSMPEILAHAEEDAYIRATLHCTMEDGMMALIERILDAMFAPLARELERLPPQALRFHVFF
jgi:hypothetical protein